jgi:hypothetical protein
MTASTQEDGGAQSSASHATLLHQLCLQQEALLMKAKALLLQQPTFENLLNDSYILRSKPVDLIGLKKIIQAHANVNSTTGTHEVGTRRRRHSVPAGRWPVAPHHL